MSDNNTANFADKYTRAAILRNFTEEKSYKLRDGTCTYGFVDGMFVNIVEGPVNKTISFTSDCGNAATAEHTIRAGDRIIVYTSRRGRDGYLGVDGQEREFQNVPEAIDFATSLWYHYTDSEKRDREIEVQIVGAGHGAECEDGSIIEDVRAVIARFDIEIEDESEDDEEDSE